MGLCWHVADWQDGNQSCRCWLLLPEAAKLPPGSEIQSMIAYGPELPV